ncbi:MAG: ShlB/FhaC/HecB family hemolysin secretion/activation protein [Cyanobacteria bacterium P01_G01_bin.54]
MSPKQNSVMKSLPSPSAFRVVLRVLLTLPCLLPSSSAIAQPLLAIEVEGERPLPAAQSDDGRREDCELHDPPDPNSRVFPPGYDLQNPESTTITAGHQLTIPQINTIVYEGSDAIYKDIILKEEIDTIYRDYADKDNLAPEQLQDLLDRITQLYLNEGYLTSRAYLLKHQAQEGYIIYIVEGQLQGIILEGRQRLNQNYLCDRIQLGVSTPLNLRDLESQLRILRENPQLKHVEADLERVNRYDTQAQVRLGCSAETQLNVVRADDRANTPPGVPGRSCLVVRVEENPPWFGYTSVNNYSTPPVGSEQLSFGLGYRNLTGRGDDLFVNYSHTTTSGADLNNFSYRLPLSATDRALFFRFTNEKNRITQPLFDVLGIRGTKDTFEVSYYQPIMRTDREQFFLSFGFFRQRGQTFAFDSPTPFGAGPEADGVSRTSVLNFAQTYLKRDIHGSLFLGSQFNLGMDLFGTTSNPSPVPDGSFVNWMGQFQRTQELGRDHFFVVRADLQVSLNSLLPVNQFVIGGGQSVRGYRQNALSGDNGFRISIEDYITLERDSSGSPRFDLIPFFDLGMVWNTPNNPNKLSDQRFLMSTGIGIQWTNFSGIEGLMVKADYGIPLILLETRGTNAQDEGFHFQVRYNYQF